MKKLTCLALAMLIPLALVQAAGAAWRGLAVGAGGGTTLPLGKNWALIIGIDHYRADKWQSLRNAVRDARAVYDLLTRRYRFGKGRTTLLLDKKATRRNILRALRNLGKRTGKNDSVLIFYSGHGFMDQYAGYWVPSDAQGPEDYINNATLRTYLKGYKCRHVLVVADSCFAGSLFRSLSVPGEQGLAYLRRVAARRSRMVLASGNLEPVLDQGFDGHSVFTYFFLKALRENKKPYLLVSSLFDEIRGLVADNAPQTPRLGTLQQARHEGGEFVFACAAPPGTSWGASTWCGDSPPVAAGRIAVDSGGGVARVPAGPEGQGLGGAPGCDLGPGPSG